MCGPADGALGRRSEPEIEPGPTARLARVLEPTSSLWCFHSPTCADGEEIHLPTLRDELGHLQIKALKGPQQASLPPSPAPLAARDGQGTGAAW